MKITPKIKSKIDINQVTTWEKATVNELRERLIDLQWNNPALSPEAQKSHNQLCDRIIHM